MIKPFSKSINLKIKMPLVLFDMFFFLNRALKPRIFLVTQIQFHRRDEE